MNRATLRRASALGLLAALAFIGRAARPLVIEAERLTGADLPSKHLVFTFDQGPSTTTAELSAYLKQHGIHATFFVDGRYAGKPDTLKALVADGHLVGNRASTNRDLANVVPIGEVPSELTATDALIAPLVPWNRKFFRAPFGSWTRSPQAISDAGDAGDASDASDLDAVFHALEKTPLDAYVGPIYWNVEADCTALTDAACADAYLQRVHSRGNGVVRFDDTPQALGAIKVLVPQLETETYVFDALDAVPAIAAMLAKCDPSCGSCTGPTASDCSRCPDGARLFEGQCLVCTVCKPGNYTAKACAGASDTLCAPCAFDGYQPAPGALSCLACGDCDDHDPCTADGCHPINGCTHTKIASCPALFDAGVTPAPDAGGSRPTGGRIDDENNIAVSADEDSGCSVGSRRATHGSRSKTYGWSSLLVALCIARIRRSLHRRARKRPLFL